MLTLSCLSERGDLANLLLTTKPNTMNRTVSALMPFLLAMALLAPIKAHNEHSSSCDTYLQEKKSCPTVNYEEINQLCCGDRARKWLHCIDRESSPVYGCFENQTIPAGYAMSLEPPDSPQRITLLPCQPSGRWFEPSKRSSIDVHYRHCTHPRSKCSSEGQMTICHGDGAADDQCGCADGYEPAKYVDSKCWKGFGGDDTCQCQKKTCPKGTARNMTLYKSPRPCSGKREEIDYTCYPIAPLFESTTLPGHDSSSSDPPHHSSTTPPPEKADTNDYLKWLWLLLLLLLIPLSAIIVYRKALWERLQRLKAIVKYHQKSAPREQKDRFLSESESAV